MDNDFTVLVEFMNRDLEKVGERVYTFREYADMIDLELKRIIMDVEDLFYDIEDGKPQEEWSEKNRSRFQKIRHKLLDQANAVKRLPTHLRYKGIQCDSMKLNHFIADFIKDHTK